MSCLQELAGCYRGRALHVILRLHRQPPMRMSTFQDLCKLHSATALKLRNMLEEAGQVVVVREGPKGAIANNVWISLSPLGTEVAEHLERAEEVLARARRARPRRAQPSG